MSTPLSSCLELLGKAQKDIDNLDSQLKNIRDGFKRGETALNATYNATREKYGAQWNELSAQFDKLLRDSCQLAKKVGEECQDFEGRIVTFMKDPTSLTTDQLIALVKSYIKGLADEQTQFGNFQTNFSGQATSIGTHSNTIQTFATNLISSERKDITTWQDKINSTNSNVTDLEKLKRDIEGSMAVYNPALAAYDLPGQLSNVVKQIADRKNDLSTSNEKINEINKSINVQQDIQSAMKIGKGANVGQITDGISSFSSIWQGPSSTTTAIQAYFQDLTPFKSLPPIALGRYVQDEASVYTSLGSVMLSYAKLDG